MNIAKPAVAVRVAMVVTRLLTRFQASRPTSGFPAPQIPSEERLAAVPPRSNAEARRSHPDAGASHPAHRDDPNDRPSRSPDTRRLVEPDRFEADAGRRRWFGRRVKNVKNMERGGGNNADIAASLKDALELLPVAIVIMDVHGTIVQVNAQTEKLFGYRRAELDGARVDLLVPDVRCDGFDALLAQRPHARQVIASGAARDVFAKRRDGTEFPVEIELSALRFDDRDAILAFVSDRTERYELHRDRQELAHLTRVSTMGELAGSLAHELNQPLTAILSNVQAAQRFMAQDPGDLNEVREILNDIVLDSCRATEIISRIRGFVRKGANERSTLDVSTVLHDVILLVHNDAIARGTRVTFGMDNDVPAVYGDKVQLQQVMLNLLLNAFDAVSGCPGADRVVAIRVEKQLDGMVHIAVRDRGHGIAADRLDSIFKPFVTSKPQGLGLGLSISRSIVDVHGGRLWAENNPDQGATFHVTLPAGDAPGREPARQRP